MVVSGSLLLTLILAAEPGAPAGTELPVRSLIVYRGQVAWIERAGVVQVKDGTAVLALDSDALAETLLIDTTNGSPEPTNSVIDPTGPLIGFVDPRWAGHAPQGIPLNVVTDANAAQTGRAWHFGLGGRDPSAEPAPERKLALLEKHGLSLVDVARIRHVGRMEPIVANARLTFPPETRSVELEQSALVWGVNWSPRYRLTLLPDNMASVRLDGTAQNLGPKPIAAERAWFSCRDPLANLGDGEGAEGAGVDTGRGMEFPVEALTLPPGEAVTRTLLETTLSTRKVHVWNVGGVTLENAPPPRRDELLAFLEVDHPDQAGLPAGPVTVTEGGKPIGVTDWPPPGAQPRSLVPLGPSNDLVFEREEVELERKRGGGGAVDEDAPADWVVMTGSLSLKNQTRQATRVRVVKTFLGEGTAASDEGHIQRRPNHLDPRHAVGEIRWDIEIPGGQTKRLTYGYQMVIPIR